jgi:ATP-binding cassette subfamily F protein 3
MAEHPTYQEKTFHRKFESSFGNLTPDKFPPIDYADREQLEMLFPLYRREYLKLEKAGKAKKLTKSVEIDYFSLKTPNKSHDIFKDTKLIIESNKRCAVYGENGSGKTCLFKAIAAGEVRDFPKYLSTHHMKEMTHNPEAEDISVIETVVSSHPFRRVLVCLHEEITRMIGEEKDEERKALLEGNKVYLEANMKRVQAETTEERAIKMLRVLGFDETGLASPMSSLSGGLRMRVALASAFIIDPDIMLLDEPTNHLDLPSVLWLENCLRGYKGSFLLVTHDRNLLENVVTSVYYLQDMQILSMPIGFAAFEKQRGKMDAKRDKMIDKFMALNRNLDPTSPLYRVKMDYQKWQKKRLERQVLLKGKFTFKAPKPLKAPEGVAQEDVSLIKIDNVRFSYDEAKGLPFIFDNPISYEVKSSTRIGVMGPNGAGKSTFLKLITGKIFPTTGSITINPDYTLAYFGQHSTKELRMELTPIEFMTESFPKANVGQLKNHLEKTSITSSTQQTRMENLSFSQRSCVIFAKLTFIPPHLLIMDEPTNFLDLDSVDSLINAANKFPGGLITVTHNRDFLKRCSKKFLSIVPGAFLEFDSMKEAERATYSFISAMERGEDVDYKNAIQQNRGGGAIHTEEEQAERQKALDKQGKDAKRAAAKKAKAAAEKAEAEALIEKRRLEKLARNRTDWKPDEKAWVPVKGKYVLGTVKRNIPGMGCSCELITGKTVMVEPKKLKSDNPNGGGLAEVAFKNPPSAGGSGGGRGGSRQGGGNRQNLSGNKTGGRGGSKTAKGRGGGRGGRGGARGGGRGGRGGGRGRGGGGRGGRRTAK